jgi:hypothetical protein
MKAFLFASEDMSSGAGENRISISKMLLHIQEVNKCVDNCCGSLMAKAAY